MSNSLRFLRNYIHDTPDATLEDVLNDDEFIEELGLKEESFLSL
jgi:hypothetical protein